MPPKKRKSHKAIRERRERQDKLKKQNLAYFNKTLKRAASLVKSKKMSLCFAAKEFDVAKSTLYHEVLGIRKATVGRSTVFNTAQEEEITDWIRNTIEENGSIRTFEIQDYVQKYLIENPTENMFKNGRPGNKWVRCFLRRHPEVYLYKGFIVDVAEKTSGSESNEEVTRSNSDDEWEDYLLNVSQAELEGRSDPNGIYERRRDSYHRAAKNKRSFVDDNEVKPCCVMLDRNEVHQYFCTETNKYKVDASSLLCKYKSEISQLCNICKKYINKNIYINHTRHCHKKYIYCKICLTKLYSYIEYNEHQLICTNFPCRYCNNVFHNNEKLRYHLIMIHNIIQTEPYQRKIKNNINNSNNNNWKNHKFFALVKRKETSENFNLVVYCTTCSKDYNYEDYFYSHFHECIKNVNFTCPLCNLSKNTLDSIDEHVNNHISTGLKFIQCNYCEASFLTDINRHNHEINNHVKHRTRRIKNTISETVTNKVLPIPEMVITNTVLPIPEMVTITVLPIKQIEIDIPSSDVLENIKYDLTNFTLFIKSELQLSENLSIYCFTCNVVFSIETYFIHVLVCLQLPEFSCPFCSNCERKLNSLKLCIQHLKMHFTNVIECECNMCQSVFFNDYNMATHAQFEHFM